MELLPYLGAGNLMLGAFVLIMQLRLEMKLTERIHQTETRLTALESR